MSRLYDGTTAVSATSFAPATTYPFTMAVWTKQTTPADATERLIHSIGTSGSNNNRYSISATGTGAFRLNARTTADFNLTSATSYNDTNWHLVVAVFTSATDRKLYVDTLASVVSDTNSSAPSATTRMRIGGNFTTPNMFYNGYVTHPAVWTVALNTDEIQMLFDRFSPMRVRRNSLIWYSPYFGRETNDISIVGTSAANNIPLLAGSAPNDGSEPAISPFVDRKLYIVSSAVGGVPAFSVLPTVQSQTAVAYTLQATPDQSATWYTAVVPAGTATPSKAQIKAGTGGGIIAAANKAVTGADTLVVGGSLTFPLHDIHSLLSNGGGDGNIATLSNEYLDPPAGKQFMVFDVPLSGTAVEHLVSASPAIADGDVWVLDLVTTPGGYTVLPSSNGELDVNVMGDTSRQLIADNVYDLSLMAYYGAGTIAINNQTPMVVGDQNEMHIFKVSRGAVLGPYDMDAEFADPESDVLTITIVDTAAFAALNLSIVSNDLGGTVPNANSINTGLTVKATDPYGASVQGDITVIVGDVTVPNVVGLDSAFAIASLTDSYLSGVVGTFVPSMQPAGTVLIQNPAAAAAVPPDTTVTLTVSSGATPATPVKTRLQDFPEVISKRRRRRIV